MAYTLPPYQDTWPRMPNEKTVVPKSTEVILMILLLIPLVLLGLYIVWEGWLMFMKCVLDGDEEEDNATELMLIEACKDEDGETMGDQIVQVAPIIDKLPPDYKFPEKIFKVDADSVSDVLRSSMGSLMSIPVLCRILSCSCCRCHRCHSAGAAGDNKKKPEASMKVLAEACRTDADKEWERLNKY